MTTATRPFGSSVKRLEDPRLISGEAKYTEDLVVAGTAHMIVVRSPYAHATITGIDTSTAEQMPGVLAAFTGRQMKEAGFGGIPCAWIVPESNCRSPRPSTRPLTSSASTRRPGCWREGTACFP